jgi:hypothetical protein
MAVGEVGSIKQTSSTYHTEKFGIEKIMPALVHHLVSHDQLQSKVGRLTGSW